MSNSPILSAEGPVECVIESGGKALSSILPIVSVDVYYGINSIPKAVIVIEDGEMSNGSFPLKTLMSFPRFMKGHWTNRCSCRQPCRYPQRRLRSNTATSRYRDNGSAGWGRIPPTIPRHR